MALLLCKRSGQGRRSGVQFGDRHGENQRVFAFVGVPMWAVRFGDRRTARRNHELGLFDGKAQDASLNVQQLEGARRVAARCIGFPRRHFPPPQFYHVRALGAREQTCRAAAIAMPQRGNILAFNQVGGGRAGDVDDVRHRQAQRRRELAQDGDAGIGARGSEPG
jgi:hypothetical protein